MNLLFEQLDFQPTPIGDLILRRRRMPQFGNTDIYDVKLGEHFLMTSLFHEAESQLAILGLGAIDRNLAQPERRAGTPVLSNINEP